MIKTIFTKLPVSPYRADSYRRSFCREQLNVSDGDILPRQQLERRLSCALLKMQPQVSVVQACHCGNQPVGIIGFEQKSIFAVSDEVVISCDITGNYRKAAGHGFGDD